MPMDWSKFSNSSNIDINSNNDFVKFKNVLQMVQGKNPQQVAMEYMQQNGISQQQFNQIQQKANELMPQFQQMFCGKF